MPEWFYLAVEILIVLIWIVVILSLGSFAATLWLFYIQEKFITDKEPYILLEIKIPADIKNPVESIEQLFHASWPLRKNLKGLDKFTDKWVEGKQTLSYSCEIVSLGGDIHFFVRIPKTHRALFESTLYSHFPDLEIEEKEDYVNLVPNLIPNQNWEIEINDFILKKEHCHPITFYSEINKAYVSEREKLELLKSELELEEKKEKIIDPMAFFLEEMSKIGPREHLWFQIIINPIDDEIPWRKEGEEIIKAGGKKKKLSLFSDIRQAIKTFWQRGVYFEEASAEPPKNKDGLLEKEREIIKRIEQKIRKYGFECVVRGVYIAHKDVFLKSKADVFKNYLFSFSSPYSNNFTDWKGFNTTTSRLIERIPYLFLQEEEKKLTEKQLKFQAYVKRDIFSRTAVIRRYFVAGFTSEERGSSVLNTEELATLYHFPKGLIFSKPSLSRISFKKSQPPKGLLYD
jgi:hypothetical protein